MTKILLVLFLAAAFSAQVLGQNKKADKLFKYYNYAEAIPYYLKALEIGDSQDKEHATLRLAECYRLTNNVPKAKEWYQKVIDLGNPDEMSYFYLGQSLRSMGLYNKAEKAFQTFNRLSPDHKEGIRFQHFCSDIQQWENLPPSAEIKNIEALNTKYADFCPTFFRDGIVFTSDRIISLRDKSKTYGWTNYNYLNLYYVRPEYYNVFWTGIPAPNRMSSDFNQHYHDGPACFSQDNRFVYVTRTVMRKGKKVDGKIKTHFLKIYSAKISEGKRLSFNPFPYNNRNYSVGHPALSKNANKIIFSSDMPGGFGGADLYVCERVNGEWTEPQNLGETINTEGNEVFPYWAEDSVLYYSSDGLLGYGGLDIFRANYEEGKWETPENLKAPINSSYDDFGIVLKEGLKEGLFSSNRPQGRGNDDIYGFKLISDEKETEQVLKEDNLAKVPSLEIQGKVKDIQGQPLGKATIFFLDPQKNIVKTLISNEDGIYSLAADYNHAYTVKAMKDGYIYDCTSFTTPSSGKVEKYKVPKDLVLMKLEVNQTFQVKNIYYDLDKWYIRDDAEESLNELVQIFKQYPITAELSSHTDSRGSNAYNKELSQKRAESAVRYIILQGVHPSRIVAKGYGETKLVNKCADGVSCTEAEHQANRRTEFKITSVNQEVNHEWFDLSKYSEGDIIPEATFGRYFFENCMK